MKKSLLLCAVVAVLSGCSSFNLGGMMYCPHNTTCSFQMLGTGTPIPVKPAAPAASGVST